MNIYTKKYLKKSNQLANKLKKEHPRKKDEIDQWLKEIETELKENKNWFLPPSIPRWKEYVLLSVPFQALVAILVNGIFIFTLLFTMIIICFYACFEKIE